MRTDRAPVFTFTSTKPMTYMIQPQLFGYKYPRYVLFSNLLFDYYWIYDRQTVSIKWKSFKEPKWFPVGWQHK